MSEILHLPEGDCARARVFMAGLVDGDLGAERSGWLRGHLERCTPCGVALARFIEMDAELRDWGKREGLECRPAAEVREQLAERMGAPQRRPMPWPATAAAFAAALAMAVFLSRGVPQVEKTATNSNPMVFVAIPYLAPPDPRESVTIVRMEVSVASLMAAGYRVAADPEAIVPAEVLVGQDGRAHAVRVLSDIELHGTGD